GSRHGLCRGAEHRRADRGERAREDLREVQEGCDDRAHRAPSQRRGAGPLVGPRVDPRHRRRAAARALEHRTAGGGLHRRDPYDGLIHPEMELDMGKKILWLDNDEAEIATWLNGLKREGHEVTNVTKLIQTWDLLATEAFDLLILDVMVPTQTEEEEVLFPPVETDLGHMSGLCFYKKLLADPTRNHLPVLVFTVRRDAK